ncbi:hypothetical protein [Streptomyces collinus]|uniref:hypothetical protein n=1 Tax=Streptomyces collinus TaxID=42684 RepID=UPI00294360DF|nr:hypothetical protein [Streptomyces collinus]
MAPGIAAEAERWTRVLRDGGPRSLPRRQATVRLYLDRARPALLAWSNRYDHLREVTREDVPAHARTLHGRHRMDELVALRSQFAWAKRSGLVFRNPAGRIKAGQIEYSVLRPLAPDKIDRSVAAATTPAARLVLALAAVHAARVAQIATLLLDDVGIGNRRLTIAGRVRPVDESPDRSRSKVASWPRRGPRIQQLPGATSARSGLVVDQQVEVGRVRPALAPVFPASPAVVSGVLQQSSCGLRGCRDRPLRGIVGDDWCCPRLT